MAKPIDVPVRIKLDDSISSQLNALAKKLQNIKMSDNISDGVKKGISKASAQVSDLQKQLQNMSKSKVDISSFDNLQSRVRDLESTVDHLSGTMDGFVQIMANASKASSFTDMIDGMKQSMNSLTQETNKTVSAIKQISELTGGKSTIQLVNKDDIAESLSLLNKIQDSLARPSLYKNLSAEDALGKFRKYAQKSSQAYKQVLNSSLSGQINTPKFDNILNEYADYAHKAQSIANTIKKTFGQDLSTSTINNISSVYNDFNKQVQNVQSIVRSKILSLNDEVSEGMSSGHNAVKSGAITIPVKLSTTEGNLTRKVESILEGVQNSVSNKPIEVQIELASKTKSKTFNRALKKFQENVDNLQDESARNEMQGLVNTLSKGYGTDITVSLRKSFDKVSDEIRTLISQLREQLTGKPLQLPDIKIPDDTIAKAKEQISKLSKQLQKEVKDGIQKSVTGMDDESVKKSVQGPISQLKQAKQISESIGTNLSESLSSISQNINKISSTIDAVNSGSLQKVKGTLSELKSSINEISQVIQKSTGVIPQNKLDSMFNDINEKAEILDKIGQEYRTTSGKNIRQSMLNRWKQYVAYGGEKSIDDLGGAKKLKDYIKRNMYDENEVPIQQVNAQNNITSQLKDISSVNNIDSITESVQKLVNVLNTPVSENSILRSIDNITKASKQLDNIVTVLQPSQSKINNIKNATDGATNKKQEGNDIVRQLQFQLNSLYNNRQQYFKLQQQSLSDNFTQSQNTRLNQLKSQYETIKSTISYLKSSVSGDSNLSKVFDGIIGQFNTRVSSDFDSKLKSITDNIQGKLKKAFQTRSNQTNDFTSDYKKQVYEVRDIIDHINSISTNHADGYIYSDSQLNMIYSDLSKINDVLMQIGNNKNIYATIGDVSKLYQKVSKDINDNSLTGSLSNRYDDLQKGLSLVIQGSQQAKDGLASITKVDLKNLTNEFQQMHGEMLSTGQQGKNFFKQFSGAITSQSANFLAQYFSLQDFIRYGQQIAQNVTQLNSALIELQKVSDASNSRIQQSFKTSSDTAQKLGATVSDVITDTADWSRLGYSIDDSEKLAYATQLFQNVGDDMSRETASNTLVSTMKAFNIDADQANDTISKYNEVANNFAIDTEGLAEGISRSGSALKAAGNTLDQSLAMMVAGNDSVQNPQTVGR